MGRTRKNAKEVYNNVYDVINKITSVMEKFSYMYHLPFLYFTTYVSPGDLKFENLLKELRQRSSNGGGGYKEAGKWYVGDYQIKGIRVYIVYGMLKKIPSYKYQIKVAQAMKESNYESVKEPVAQIYRSMLKQPTKIVIRKQLKKQRKSQKEI